jgi:hypothetical protein
MADNVSQLVIWNGRYWGQTVRPFLYDVTLVSFVDAYPTVINGSLGLLYDIDHCTVLINNCSREAESISYRATVCPCFNSRS